MSDLLTLRNVTKRFGGLVAVNEVSFTLGAGEVVGLLGPNGSGKSTVMNLISGELPATSGSITFDGTDIGPLPPHRIAKLGISRTFQLVRLAESLSVRDNVIMPLAFASPHVWGRKARRRADAALERVGLGGQGDMAPADLNYIDQKRVELARAIAPDPKLLLLDEWMAGLNPSELRTAIELIRGLGDTGITIFLVEHIMEAVRELCPRCIVANAGSVIADGPTEAVLSTPDVRRAYLGEAADV
ncbi:ABC transporter ATP-binding protein [uncultured Maritimibacter sp.]|jgi:branched-chain amino acid transport system ATP-binding protein|uniref:ABC transporter ATP-binding protein n=1 Tax=uncultured Maritimibacter sp. TaxID=991866 RepID=UPI000AC140B6|nr:ABC transporter ATP-binding protein [uncultured Maritimibacter sp.]